MTVVHRLTAAQYETARLAATRPSRALEPLPSNIKGAARQSVLAALVAHGYAVKCYLPGHVEYVLTDAGLVQLNWVGETATPRVPAEWPAARNQRRG